MEKFSDLLGIVRSNSGVPFSSCEPELIELMRQLDGMIEEKQREWRLTIIQLEMENGRLMETNLSLQNQVRASNHELSKLQMKIRMKEDMQGKNEESCSGQVSKLKQELHTLKRNYHKLLKKASDHRKAHEQAQSIPLEKTNDKKDSMNILDTHQQLLKKCDLMQEQLLSYQTQLNKKTKKVEEIEQRRDKEMLELEKKLREYKMKVLEKDENIARLKLQETDLSKISKCHPTNENINRMEEKQIWMLEESVRRMTSRLDMKICELQVSNAQIEALRLENDHLRSLLHQSSNNKKYEIIEPPNHENVLDYSISSISSIESQGVLSSQLEEFLYEEKSKEDALKNRILSYINDFDNKVDLLRKE